MEKLISVVIPAKNEEGTIANCIESAINALKNIHAKDTRLKVMNIPKNLFNDLNFFMFDNS